MNESKNKVISVRVEIDAPASFVWDILIDLPRYPEWNPYTVRVESTLKLGAPVHLYLAGTNENPSYNLEYLVAFEPGRLLSWEQYPTETDTNAARRDQVIEAIDAEHCAYYTTDQFLGVNADKIMADFGDWVKQGFDSIALALKQRAESLYKAEKSVAIN